MVMIRSGRLLMWVVGAATSLGVVALVFVILKSWLGLVAVAVVWVVLIAVAVVLHGRADPEALKARSAESERVVQAIARSLGRSSGGWDARSPRSARREDER